MYAPSSNLTKKRWNTCLGIFGILLAFGLYAEVLAANTNPVNNNKENTTNPAKTKQLEQPKFTSTGLILDRPKWQGDQKKGKNIGLVVTYTWGNKPKRNANVTDGGTYWRITFLDKPDPKEVVKIELHYLFEIKDKDKIVKTIDAIYQTLIKLIKDASQKTKPEDALNQSLGQLLTVAKALDNYQTQKGTSFKEVTLKAFGLVKESDKWKIGSRSRQYLQSFVNQLSVKRRLRSFQERLRSFKTWTQKQTGDDCLREAKIAMASAFEKAAPLWQKTILKCSQSLPQELKVRLNLLIKSKDAPTQQALQQAYGAVNQALNKFKEAAKKLTKPMQIADKTDTSPFNKEWKTLKKSLEEFRKKLTTFRFTDTKGWKAIYLATSYFKVTALKDQPKEVFKKITEQAKRRVETLAHTELGTLLIETSQTRMYEVSTGFVYVPGIDDVVMPVLLSFCPLGNCLRKGRAFYQSLEDFGNSLSIDFGIAANILDDPSDPRHRGPINFLAGISWNPIYFFRISGGAYFFNNSQTGTWNTSAYFGITLNFLHAAELLGVLGFGVPEPRLIKK